jgi:peroxiredoxin
MQQSIERAAPLPPGAEAPDFELPSTPDQTVSLAEFRGQPVILAFYPEDWSPVCSDQLALYQGSARSHSTVRSHRARTAVAHVETAQTKVRAKGRFIRMERAGFEPAASGLQSRRSPS